MNYVSLGEADRQRFDCKEWLPVELADITAADVEELSERFGFDPLDWPEPMIGPIRIEDAGQPDPPRQQPRWYARALVWMALRQNGLDVSWDDAGTVAIFRTRHRRDPEEEPGKEDGATSPSETSDASMTPPLPSSSD